MTPLDTDLVTLTLLAQAADAIARLVLKLKMIRKC